MAAPVVEVELEEMEEMEAKVGMSLVVAACL